MVEQTDRGRIVSFFLVALFLAVPTLGLITHELNFEIEILKSKSHRTDTSPGNYTNPDSPSGQSPCPSGTYQPLSNQTNCIDASPGYYVGISGATFQTPCPLGTWQNQSQSTSCNQATSGHSTIGGIVESIAGGESSYCALLKNNSVYCWGRNNVGQLGNGYCQESESCYYSSSPQKVNFSIEGEISSLVGNGNRFCVVIEDVQMFCWGSNDDGGLGAGLGYSSQTSVTEPTAVSLPENDGITSISENCATLINGRAYCWGNRYFLGNTTHTGPTLQWWEDEDSPIMVNFSESQYVNKVASTPNGGVMTHSCAIVNSSDIYCWGDNNRGRITTNSTFWTQCYNCATGGFLDPVDINFPANENPLEIYVGETSDSYHNCAIAENNQTNDKSVICWGQNGWGQLGSGHFLSGDFETFMLPENEIPSEVFITFDSVCVTTESSSIYCTGSLRYRLDDRSTGWATSSISGKPVEPIPVKVDFVSNEPIIQIATSHGSSSVCILSHFGSVSCAGANEYGELGNGTISPYSYDRPFFQEILNLSLTATHQSDCSIGTFQPNNQSIECIESFPGHYVGTNGSNQQFQCQLGYYQPALAQENCIASSVGHFANPNRLYQQVCPLGTYQPTIVSSNCTSSNPGNFVMENRSSWEQISAGDAVCGIVEDFDYISGNYNLFCWGDFLAPTGSWGQIAPNGEPNAVFVPEGTMFSKVSARGNVVCALSLEKNLYCWGSDEYSGTGEFSLDADIPRIVPTPFGQEIISFSTGGNGACYLTNTSNLYCWGQGNLAPTHYVPVEISVNQTGNLTEVHHGGNSVCVLNDLDELYCWGEIYTNTGVWNSSHIPSQMNIPHNSTITSISLESSIICLTITYDDEVYCKGPNSWGMLGRGHYNSVNQGLFEPVNLPQYFIPRAISIGDSACALGDMPNNPGVVYCWGSNYMGSLGNSNYSYPSVTKVNTPVIVDYPSGFHATNISVGIESGCSIRNDGAIYCWGAVPANNEWNSSHNTLQNISLIKSQQFPCPVGTWQNLSSQSDCTLSNPGYYTNLNGSTNQIPCSPGTYQPNSGEVSCINADAGYFVDSSAATSQTACSPGTYQPNSGQVSCIDADAGYFVDNSAATSQTACSPGTYQPNSGQVSCIDADAGYFVDNSAATSQTACSPGTYQPNSGQVSCIDADAGYFVDIFAANSQTACSPGTHQPNSGQASCINADAGYFVDSSASTSQTACGPGTYQPNSGQAGCIDADAGYFVDSSAATSQTACGPGTYNSQLGSQSPNDCLNSDPGFFVEDFAATSQTACSPGTYQPNSGQVGCIDADAGYFVDSSAATSQTACGPGTYQPNSGLVSCIDADAGYFVGSSSAISQTACNPGTYQPFTGQTDCINAYAGYFVDSSASTSQTSCSPATYQPNSGQVSCIDADAGYFVDSSAAISQTACSPGTYQPNSGHTLCFDAPMDSYISGYGEKSPTPCPPFHMTSSSASISIDQCILDSDSDRVPDGMDEDDDNDGIVDHNDNCSPGLLNWSSGINNDRDSDGCRDFDEDLDDDNDGRLDEYDMFPHNPLEQDDSDLDGIGDFLDFDDDNDGISDAFEYDLGTDPLNSDTDQDGVGDKSDVFPLDSSEWSDKDKDGVGDNIDILPDVARYQYPIDVIIDVVILIGFLVLISFIYQKRGPKSQTSQNILIEDSPRNLEKFDDYPGWLWDPINESWISEEE